MSTVSARPGTGALLRKWSRRLGDSTEQRVVTALTLFCVGLGLWLRARGFFYSVPALWLDESEWAMMLVRLPLVDLLIRPVGFMAISKVMAAIFGPSEAALRTLPWCAGVTAVLIAPELARRLFSSPASRLLFVAIVALHPCAIDFSKEFKPYSVSLALHLGCLLLTLRYLQLRRDRDLGWLLGVLVVGVLFSQDLVFAYPGIFILAGREAYQARRRRHLLSIALAGTVIIGALLAQYILIWSRISAKESDYWGEKYDVFFTGSGSYASWFLERYANLAAFPGYQLRFWNAVWFTKDQLVVLRGIAGAVWDILHAVGIVCLLWRCRFREVVLLVLPLFVLWSFNLAGFWPFGVFRTNVFLVGYLAAIAAMAFDPAPDKPRRFTALIPAVALVLVPIFVFEKGWGAAKRALTTVSNLPLALEWLVSQDRPRRGGREILLMDRRTCPPVRYYKDFHPELSQTVGRALDKRFTLRCIHDDTKMAVSIEQVLSKKRTTWVILHRGQEVPLRRYSQTPGVAMVARMSVDSHVVIGFTKERPAPKRHSPPTPKAPD